LIKRQVLVVDDHQDQAQMLALLLRNLGHEVHTAHDGHAAIREALRLEPDFLFIELSLPVLDGWQVTRQLRADARFSMMRIVAMTRHGDGELRQKSLDAGVDAHLVKPVDPQLLISLLGRLNR
jgi:CheY-like chemotaxis protein